MADISSLLSRRNLLLTLAGGTATTVTLTSTPSGEALTGSLSRLVSTAKRKVTGIGLANASFEDWAAQTETLFTAQTGHVLKLVNVGCFAARSRPKGLRERAFAARFDVVVGDALPGDITYRFNHASAGVFDIFLTAEDPANPKRMMAVFN